LLSLMQPMRMHWRAWMAWKMIATLLEMEIAAAGNAAFCEVFLAVAAKAL